MQLAHIRTISSLEPFLCQNDTGRGKLRIKKENKLHEEESMTEEEEKIIYGQMGIILVVYSDYSCLLFIIRQRKIN